jgi:hypothetical protein
LLQQVRISESDYDWLSTPLSEALYKIGERLRRARRSCIPALAYVRAHDRDVGGISRSDEPRVVKRGILGCNKLGAQIWQTRPEFGIERVSRRKIGATREGYRKHTRGR